MTEKHDTINKKTPTSMAELLAEFPENGPYKRRCEALKKKLITQSRKHYRRFYRLAGFAVILMTAVLTVLFSDLRHKQ
jgi:hypothetical protein